MKVNEVLIKNKEFDVVTEKMALFEKSAYQQEILKHGCNPDALSLQCNIQRAIKRLFCNEQHTLARRTPFVVYTALNAVDPTWQSNDTLYAVTRAAIRWLDLDLLAEVLAAPGYNPWERFVVPGTHGGIQTTPIGYTRIHCPEPRKVLPFLVRAIRNYVMVDAQAVNLIVAAFLDAVSIEKTRAACKKWEKTVDYVTDAMRAVDFTSPAGLFFWLLGHMRHALNFPELSGLDDHKFWAQIKPRSTGQLPVVFGNKAGLLVVIATQAVKIFGTKRAISYVTRGLAAGHEPSLKRAAEEELAPPAAKRQRPIIVIDG